MKIMVLDSTLPILIDTPVNPETGEAWHERFIQIIEATAAINSAQFSIDRHRAEKHRKELMEGVQFIRQTYIVELENADKGETEDKIYSMHPEAFAMWPEAARKTWVVQDGDALRKKREASPVAVGVVKELALPAPEA